jgi:hypothetical protein
LTLEWLVVGLVSAMDRSDDHQIKLHFADSQPCSLGGVLEATGLFLSAFVEGDVVHDGTYEYSIECVAPQDFVIRAKLIHPLEERKIALDRLYARLYIVFTAWFLAGASVRIEGPWEGSFPGRGSLDREANAPLLLRPLFQDEMQISKRTVYPSLETLSEIHCNLKHYADWGQLQENPAFQKCFTIVSPPSGDNDNIRLTHGSRLHVDLVLTKGLITYHILECVQEEIDLSYIGCEQEARYARTWWDAWIEVPQD